MSKFLKLTENIINTSQINRIQILQNKYRNLTMNNGTDGLHKVCMDTIIICAEKDASDYKKLVIGSIHNKRNLKTFLQRGSRIRNGSVRFCGEIGYRAGLLSPRLRVQVPSGSLACIWLIREMSYYLLLAISHG